MKKKGFTLIELLIVVAIIAILAAIAVPNFLEAQVRSKVSRVRADARSIATGVEAYMVDNNRLFRTFRVTGETREYLMRKLTTPVAYLSSISRDPFNLVDLDNGNRVIVLWGPDYIEGGVTIDGYTLPDSTARSATFFSPYPDYSDGTTLLRRGFWVLFSLGPDKKYDVLDP
ncbi:MAG TPA: prepilin-type N-terminal cleavage/methylation domain-containing protein, partial [Candidatus Sumerlaeota bacterium]|nr:prepilin-type N-terminal cleavage/methylation domain-containing protein [Candidatus Sumerlaeota bacterium]